MKHNINKSAVRSLQDRINKIVEHDLYIRVAAMLHDAGVRSDSLCGDQTIASALCSGPNAAPSPYATNAVNYLRQWERDGKRPEGIPLQ